MLVGIEVDGKQLFASFQKMFALHWNSKGFRTSLPLSRRSFVEGLFVLGWRLVAHDQLLLMTPRTNSQRMGMAECMVKKFHPRREITFVCCGVLSFLAF